jgi:cytoskeletal protein CcmA (bactofilin family)
MNILSGLFFLCASLSLNATKQSVSGSSTFADVTFDQLKTSGSSTLTRVVVNDLTCSGSCKFTDLTVRGHFTGSGSRRGTGLTANTCDFSGSTGLQDAVLESLTLSGSLTATRVSIAKDCQTSGSCEADELMVEGFMNSSGRLTLRNSTVHELQCSSKAKLYDTTVNGSVTVAQTNSSRSGWQTDISWLRWLFSLFSFRNDSDDEDDIHTLYIYGTTKITGDVTFESGDGVVYCDSKAEVLGVVHGGKIIK